MPPMNVVTDGTSFRFLFVDNCLNGWWKKKIKHTMTMGDAISIHPSRPTLDSLTMGYEEQPWLGSLLSYLGFFTHIQRYTTHAHFSLSSAHPEHFVAPSPPGVALIFL